MTRIGWYLARRFTLILAGTLVLVGIVLLGLGGLSGSLPSLWSIVMPSAWVAAWLSRRRAIACGEDVAVAVSGIGAWRELLPSALTLSVVQLLFCWPVGAPLEQRQFRSGSVVSGWLDGRLCRVLARGAEQPAVMMSPDGRLEHVSPIESMRDLPDGFVLLPRRVGRARMQLFLRYSPTGAPDHPLDPAAWRWLYLGSGLLGVLVLLRHRSP